MVRTLMISKQLLNLYGTHLACAELALNGIIPVVTSRNTKGVGIIAVSRDGQLHGCVGWIIH